MEEVELERLDTSSSRPEKGAKRTIRYAEEESDMPASRRVIRFGDDEEAGEASTDARRLQRRLSVASQISTASSQNSANNSNAIDRARRGSIDPRLGIPIEYRTLSIHVEQTKERAEREQALKDSLQVKEAAAPPPVSAKPQKKAADELAGMDFHTASTDELSERFSTSPSSGLTTQQAAANLSKYGPNKPSPPPKHMFSKIMGYFFGGFGSILLLGGILVFISWKPLGKPPEQANLALGIVLIAVFVIQAAFNAWQDFSSSRVMDSITGMLPESSYVLRNGEQISVAAFDVVPGDILVIKAGQKLPADVRFVEVSTDVKFDRSILTGESLPIAGSVDNTDENYLETRNIGMQGTHCISGSARGLVVATGDETVFGKIAKLTSRPDNKMTPLQKEILRFVIIICSLALMFIVIIAAVWGGYLRKNYPDYIGVSNFIVSLVSVGIAFVPEGLPIALTASLTIVAGIMKKNNVLCKSLKTVETLGAVSVICSDKTGTLTKNIMTATDCAIMTRTMTPVTALSELESNMEKRSDNNAVRQLRSLAGICNAGMFDPTTLDRPLAERVIQGDATDQAVLRFSESLGSVDTSRSLWRRVFEIAFNSKNKFMIRVFNLEEAEGIQDTLARNDAFSEDDMLLTIKGAPDVLIGRCTSVLNPDGMVVPFNDEFRRQVEAIKDDWSANGKRVILLARKVLSSSVIKNNPNDGAFEDETMEHAGSGLTLVGLIGIVDPPRDEIPEVVKTLRRAGIRIFMVTGDFKLTAQAIAQQCGIITTPRELTDDIQALNKYRSSSDVSGSTINQASAYHANDKPGMSSDMHPEDIKSIVLSGSELNSLTDSQWTQLCSYDEIVFARTTPEQKLRIVNEFQRHDNLVAMTGDGVNDAPSLKAADIGIALGTGSDIAIEASDMVLLDSFGGVVAAVLYGRIVFDNLKKTIVYLLPAGTFSEFWPVFTNIVFGLPQILSSFLMIMICCLTDCAAATTLAYEKPEADVMLRPPRRAKKDKLVDWRLLLHAYGFLGLPECICSFAMAYWYCERNGVPFSTLWFKYGNWGHDDDGAHTQAVLATASSIYFVNLVVMQWFNVMATRTRRLSIIQHPPAFNKLSQNYLIFPAIVFALVVVFIFCYIPGLQRVIGSSQIPVEYFFLPMAFGFGLLLLDEGRKYCVRRYPTGFLAKCAW